MRTSHLLTDGAYHFSRTIILHDSDTINYEQNFIYFINRRNAVLDNDWI